MKITKKQILSFLLISLFFSMQILGVFFINHEASAATTLWDRQVGLGGDNEGEIGKTGFSRLSSQPDDIRFVVAKIIKIILSFLGTIFVILMLIAGFKWMSSRGDENTISESKNTITAAVIGLFIVMASYAITQLVINYMYNVTP